MAFNIHLLRGEDPQAQYDAIATKDPDTLYLLQSGKGYLGDFMLFNADSNIDFADLQQVKDKLTYTETDEEGEHTYSTIIGHCEDGTNTYPINPMCLMPDNGVGVVTDEILYVIYPELAADWNVLWEQVLKTGEFDEEQYKTSQYLVSTVPTLQCMMSYVQKYVNKKLEPYVTHSIDDGTAAVE